MCMLLLTVSLIAQDLRPASTKGAAMPAGSGMVTDAATKKKSKKSGRQRPHAKGKGKRL